MSREDAMAHVLTYYRVPDEEPRLLAYLAKTGDIMACTTERMADPRSPALEPRPIRQLIEEQDPARILIGPRAFMDMAPIDEFELNGQISYGRYYMNAPLVDYSRGRFFDGNALLYTNLAFESFGSTYDDAHTPEERWTPHPPEFVAWAKRVLAWARRDAPRVVGHKRMTERVFDALASGLELVP